MTYHAPITGRLTLPCIEPVAARVRGLDVALWALLTKPTPLTAEEWGYLETAEARDGLEEVVGYRL